MKQNKNGKNRLNIFNTRYYYYCYYYTSPPPGILVGLELTDKTVWYLDTSIQGVITLGVTTYLPMSASTAPMGKVVSLSMIYLYFT